MFEDEKVGKTGKIRKVKKDDVEEALKHTYTINYIPSADKRSHGYWTCGVSYSL